MAGNGLSRNAILLIFAMCLTTIVMGNDFSSMNIAIPSIEKTFDTNLATAQWVVNAFMLSFAVLIVTGGRIADIYGRRRSYFIGTAIFAVASFAGGFSTNIYMLIGFRLLMGIGAAIVFPAVVGILYETLTGDRAALAGGLFAGSVGTGEVIGPILGGFLTTYLSWRWILFINLPIMVIAMVISWRVITPDPESAGEGKRIDYLGSVLIGLGLFALLFAFDQSSSWGWGDPRIIALLVVAVVSLVVFVLVERRIGERALVPREVMRNREFMVNMLAVVLLSAPFFVAMLYIPQFAQKFLGYSALVAGVALVPMVATFAVSSFISGSIYDKIGPKLTVSGGAALLVVGTTLLAVVPDDPSFVWFIPGMLVLGAGIGIFFSAATTAGVTSLDEALDSLGGGLIMMARIMGGAIGIALTTAVFMSASRNEVSDLASDAGISLSNQEVKKLDNLLINSDSATQALMRFPEAIQTRITGFAEDAFMSGFQAGMLANVVLAAVGFVLVLIFVGGSFHLRQLGPAERAARARVSRYVHRFHG